MVFGKVSLIWWSWAEAAYSKKSAYGSSRGSSSTSQLMSRFGEATRSAVELSSFQWWSGSFVNGSHEPWMALRSSCHHQFAGHEWRHMEKLLSSGYPGPDCIFVEVGNGRSSRAVCALVRLGVVALDSKVDRYAVATFGKVFSSSSLEAECVYQPGSSLSLQNALLRFATAPKLTRWYLPFEPVERQLYMDGKFRFVPPPTLAGVAQRDRDFLVALPSHIDPPTFLTDWPTRLVWIFHPAGLVNAISRAAFVVVTEPTDSTWTTALAHGTIPILLDPKLRHIFRGFPHIIATTPIKPIQLLKRGELLIVKYKSGKFNARLSELMQSYWTSDLAIALNQTARN